MDFDSFKQCVSSLAIEYYQRREMKKIKLHPKWKAPKLFEEHHENLKHERIKQRNKINEVDYFYSGENKLISSPSKLYNKKVMEEKLIRLGEEGKEEKRVEVMPK